MSAVFALPSGCLHRRARPGYAWVSAGMTLIPLAGSSWGSTGVADTVASVTPDPNGNANVPGPYPGDVVTLTIARAILGIRACQFYLASPGGY